MWKGNPEIRLYVVQFFQWSNMVGSNGGLIVSTWKEMRPWWPRGRKMRLGHVEGKLWRRGLNATGIQPPLPKGIEHRPPRRTEHPADAFMLSEIGDINEYRCRSKVRRNRSLASFSIIQNRKPRTRCSSICLIVVCVTS